MFNNGLFQMCYNLPFCIAALVIYFMFNDTLKDKVDIISKN